MGAKRIFFLELCHFEKLKHQDFPTAASIIMVFNRIILQASALPPLCTFCINLTTSFSLFYFALFVLADSFEFFIKPTGTELIFSE